MKPEIKFSSDFIIGYPGETDDDFKKTIELMTKVGLLTHFLYISAQARNTSF